MLSAARSQRSLRTRRFQVRAEWRGGCIPVTALARSEKKPKPPDFSAAWAKRAAFSLWAEEPPRPTPHLRYGPAPEMGVAQRDASTLTASASTRDRCVDFSFARQALHRFCRDCIDFSATGQELH
ncbi:hypothetical protein NDU88_003844 [Pleurodeles waltl]|uniref:Uncharacterized protein n=1 Tax=Pleurodeles waltl TaxID=8319 RepID=A0AAV7LJL2_PLEWA|nr:hypothetical protein NDU88_003844 [Pleurodeles waltl]